MSTTISVAVKAASDGHQSISTGNSNQPTENTQASAGVGGPNQSTSSQSSVPTDSQSAAKTGPSDNTSSSTSSSTSSITVAAVATPVSLETSVSSAETPTSTSSFLSAADSMSSTTTSTSSVASPSTPTHSAKSTNFTSGALAGGIIGAFVAGLLLALMAAYFFNMRQRRRRTASGDPRGSSPAQHKGTAYEKVPGSGGVVPSWERYLPQSIDDQSMKASVQSLLNQINLHVDNFYTRSEAAIDNPAAENLVRMDTGLLPETLPAMMAQPKSQTIAIKHSIAYIIITRMLPNNNPDTSLLPPHLAMLPEKLQSDPGSGKETPATRQAYCQWKLLTSYLYHDVEPTTAVIAQQRKASMSIIKIVTAAFSQWEVKPTEGPSAAEHLAQIIDVARDVGTTVMSQGSSFDLRWRLSARQQGTETFEHLVVFPGFVKVTDEKGRPLERVQTLVRPLAQDLSGGN